MDVRDLERALSHVNEEELGRTSRCPNETAVAEYVDGKSEGFRKLRLERHISTCEYCLHQIALLQSLRNSELPHVPKEILQIAEDLVEDRPKERSRFFSKPAWKWSAASGAIAAGVLLVAALFLGRPIWSPSQEPATPPAYRANSDSVENDSELVVTTPPDGSTFASTEMSFSWIPIPGALYYEIEVVDLEGNPVWLGRVQGSESFVSPDSVIPPGDFFLVVRAIMGNGRSIASEFTQFSVR